MSSALRETIHVCFMIIGVIAIFWTGCAILIILPWTIRFPILIFIISFVGQIITSD